MARHSSVRYYESRGGFFSQVNGRQVKLASGPDDREINGPVYRAACKTFEQLMHQEKASDDMSFGALLAAYKRHLESRSPANLEVVCALLDGVTFGDLEVSKIRPHHVEAWIEGRRKNRGGKRRGWGDTRTNMALSKLLACFAFGVRKGMISKAPVQRNQLDVPTEKKRGRDVVITPEENAAILRESRIRFRRFWAFLWQTGCRPQEARHVEAHNYDPESKAIVFRHDARPGQYLHKTAKKTKKDRTIYLNEEMNGLVAMLCQERPTGPIFTNSRGKGWTVANLSNILRAACKRAGIKKPVICYSARHSYCTRFLLAGRSISILAELVGNTPTTIQKHYSHLCTGAKLLREQVNEFSR